MDQIVKVTNQRSLDQAILSLQANPIVSSDDGGIDSRNLPLYVVEGFGAKIGSPVNYLFEILGNFIFKDCNVEILGIPNLNRVVFHNCSVSIGGCESMHGCGAVNSTIKMECEKKVGMRASDLTISGSVFRSSHLEANSAITKLVDSTFLSCTTKGLRVFAIRGCNCSNTEVTMTFKSWGSFITQSSFNGCVLGISPEDSQRLELFISRNTNIYGSVISDCRVVLSKTSKVRGSTIRGSIKITVTTGTEVRDCLIVDSEFHLYDDSDVLGLSDVGSYAILDSLTFSGTVWSSFGEGLRTLLTGEPSKHGDTLFIRDRQQFIELWQEGVDSGE